jgi:uncharacterized protein (TIGR00725 family)
MIPQIAVIGSAKARPDFAANIEAAKQLGVALAAAKARLVFGVEGNDEHLPEVVYQVFAAAGGEAIGIYRRRDDYLVSPYKSLIPIVCTMHRAAGWEAIIVQSAQAVIVVGGGAGTLQEIAIAYQSGIPIIVLQDSGGWADAFATMPVDFRRRQVVHMAATPKEAVGLALRKAVLAKLAD